MLSDIEMRRTVRTDDVPDWMFAVLCDLQKAASAQGLHAFSQEISRLRDYYELDPGGNSDWTARDPQGRAC